jgi:hypothetical protein
MEKGRKGSYRKTEGGSPTFWKCSLAVLEAISKRTFNPSRNNIVARRKDLKYSISWNMGGDGHDAEELKVDQVQMQVQVHHSRGSELSGEIGELDDDIQKWRDAGDMSSEWEVTEAVGDGLDSPQHHLTPLPQDIRAYSGRVCGEKTSQGVSVMIYKLQ